MDFKVLLPSGVSLPRECIEAAGNDELIAGILYRRGIDKPEKIEAFLYEDKYRPFNPSEFENVKEAIKLILSSANQDAKVCIYGDYDVDGITSSVLLVEALEPLVGNVIYHIPHRFTEGYGMDIDVVRELGDRDVDLIVTCDCGISNVDEIELARNLGMDVIVTDHHTPPEILPPANVILNPKLYGADHPLYPLPGVGVAYILVRALYEKLDRPLPEGRWLDLVALGIIADVVPVLGECRYLLRKGLPCLLNPERVGLRALYRVLSSSGCKVEDEEDIAFQVSPRINAAGRMDSPYLPAELLLEKDMDRALDMAADLDSLNRERKALQNQIFDRAVEMVEAEQIDEGILVLYGPYWHEGVLGIVAGKVAEQYMRPCICLTLKDDGSTVTGSARSVGDVSIYELLAQSANYLTSFGGHKMAAGMSLALEDVEEFTRHIQGLLPIEEGVQESLVDVDVEIDISSVDDLLLSRIDRMAPFGHGFPKPIFQSKDVDIISNRPIGKNHRKFIFSGGDSQLNGIWWWASPEYTEELGKSHMIYTLGRNRGELSLTILEMERGESREPVAPAFDYDIFWHDHRGEPIEDTLKGYSDATIYYEGIKDIGYDTATRYELMKADTIILLSTPPAPALFRELMLLSGAKRVVLGFGDESRLGINELLRRLQGLLKHTIKCKGGIISLQELSTLLCTTEEFIELCLVYLKERGFIDYLWEDGDQLTIYRGSNGKLNNRTQTLLHRSFYEMMSFKRYMYYQTTGKLENLLKNPTRKI